METSVNIKKKILFFAADMGGCAQYRLMLPATALVHTGRYDCRISMVINQEKYDWKPEVVVFARQHKPDVQKAIMAWKKLGARVIYDTDDDLFHVPMSNPAYSVLKPLKKEICDTIKLADVLTVSTPPLVEAYKHLNPNIKVLPNQIALDYGKMYKTHDDGTVRIGWAGTNTHVGDFKEADRAIVEVAKKYPNVKFVFMGYAPDYIIDNIPQDKVEFRKGVKIEKYHAALGELSLDIGLAPLENNTFNVGKSNLKVLEYGIMGVPTVASPVYPYVNTIFDGYDGILVKKNRYKNWVDSLSRLIENETERKTMGKNIQTKIVTKYNVLNNYKLWEDVYFPEEK